MTKTIYLLLFMSVLSLGAQPDQKTKAKKAITASYHILGALPTLISIKALWDAFNREKYRNEPDVPPASACFIKNILFKAGVTHADSLILKVQEQANVTVVTNRVLLVGAPFIEQLERILAIDDNATSALDYKAYITAIIQHEASHIKNYDLIRMVSFTAFVPLLIHSGATWLINKDKSNSTSSFLMKVSAALGIEYCLTFLAQSWYSRYLERTADNAIDNDPALLNAISSHFNHEHNAQNNTLKPTLWNRICSLFDTHPSMPERVASFQNRIKN